MSQPMGCQLSLLVLPLLCGYSPALAMLDSIFLHVLCVAVFFLTCFRNVIIITVERHWNRVGTRIGSRGHAVEIYIDVIMNGVCTSPLAEPQWLAQYSD